LRTIFDRDEKVRFTIKYDKGQLISEKWLLFDSVISKVSGFVKNFYETTETETKVISFQLPLLP